MREMKIMRLNNLTLRTIVTLIISSSANWNHLQSFAITVMNLKEEEERRRQAMPRTPSPDPDLPDPP